MNSTKTALITGSTSGIGLEIAREFAKQGTNLVLNGFGNAQEIETLRAGLAKEHKIEVIYSPADISKPADMAQMIALAESKFGGVDILVNNAGIQFVSPIEEFPIEKWDSILSINLSGAFYATRLVVPYMREKKWGRIINMSSAHGLVASPFKAAYVAAKHGLLGLTKTVALETAEAGITVNAICPGYVMTPLVQKQIPDTAKARGISEEAVIRDVILEAQPTKKFVEVSDVGALAVFLASDAASSITGAALSIDGGWTAH